MKDIAKIKKLIGQKIKNERKKIGMSAEELAFALNISKSYVGLIERGQRGTNIKLLLDICQVLSIDISDLLSDKKLILSDNKFSSSYKDKTKTINTLIRSLDINELDFIIATIRSLNNMKIKRNASKKLINSDCDSSSSSKTDTDPEEKFY